MNYAKLDCNKVIIACERLLKAMELKRLRRREELVQAQMKVRVGWVFFRRYQTREEAIAAVDGYYSYRLGLETQELKLINKIKNLRDIAILSKDSTVFVDDSYASMLLKHMNTTNGTTK